MRVIGLASAPPGLSVLEAQDAQIAELIRIGRVQVLYNTGTEGREALYHVLLSIVTTFVGNDPFGYRLLSVLVGLLTLSLVYAVARRLYGRTVGLATMGVMLVPLWGVLLSRSISRETLLPFVVVITLITLSRALPVYRQPKLDPDTLPFGLLGLVLGLGFYVHPVHYIIVLMSMTFIIYMVATRQPMSRRTLSYLSFSIVILVIVAAPYLISSLQLPNLSGATRLLSEVDLISDEGILLTLWEGLVGLVWRGDADVLNNVPGRPYIDVLSGVVMLLGIVYAARRVSTPRYGLAIIALVYLLPVALFAPASPNFMAYSAALPLLAIFFGIGVKQLHQWVGRRGRWLAVGVVVLLAANAVWTLYSLHAVWAPSEAVQQAYHERVYTLANYLDRTADDSNTVVCVPRLPEANPTWLSDPDKLATLLALMMDSPAERQMRYVDCGMGLVFTQGGDDEQIILLEAGAEEDFHPYVQAWLDYGERLDQDVPAGSVVWLDVTQRLGDTVGRFTTTAPVGYAPESPGGVGAAPLPVNFDQNLTFLGYDEVEETYQPGGVATVITYWRVDGDLPPDMSIFTHVLFDAESIVAQTDTINVLPGRLQPRDVFIQITLVPLPDTLPTGTYQTSTGAYELNDEDRLDVLQDGQPRGTRLFMHEIVIQ